MVNPASTAAVTINARPVWRDYLELCKPKVVGLMLATALVGMLLATPYQVPWTVLVFGTLGIGLAAGSAAIINHLVDQHVDAIMLRTHKRPLPTGRLTPKAALRFAMVLGLLGMLVLWFFTNPLATLLSFVTLLGYAVVYTMYLKRATPQNIVIGGATGAAPPLLGWVAVTGTLDPNAWLLVLIIFVWTPPHFWALAIHRYKEYAQVKIPMLPVTHGIPFTKLCITLYTILLIAVSVLPFVVQMSGVLYLIGALLLGAGFMYHALVLQWTNRPLAAIKTFQYSITYLLILFIVLLVDHYL